VNEVWGKVYNAKLIKGCDCVSQKLEGQEGRLKVEDIITFFSNRMVKPFKSSLVAQTVSEDNILNVRTIDGLYKFQIL